MQLLPLLTGLVTVAHAQNNPTLNTWGQNAPGVSAMWTTISNSVYTNIPASDIVHALTGGLVSLIFTVISGAAVLLIMYAGIRMIIARGKDDEFTQGKTIITWALIGLALSVLASVIITFFESGFLPTFLQ
jgi:hypothetical protein